MLILSANSACDICLDPYDSEGGKAPASLGCGHIFCRSCLYTLATRLCPVCRAPFDVISDMRKLHVDLESRFAQEITGQEKKALDACQSGDLFLMEEGVLKIEQWLQSQPPGLRCSLSTVVALVRLFMEATSQLHAALERSQTDEKTLRMRQELDSMKAAADRRRLQQETEALRVGMGRQREHLAYLESELAKARANAAVVPEMPVTVMPVSPKRPALPKPPSALPPQPHNTTPSISIPSRGIIDAPTPQRVQSPRPMSPIKTISPLVNLMQNAVAGSLPDLKNPSVSITPPRILPNSAPVANGVKSAFSVDSPVMARQSRPATPTRPTPESAPVTNVTKSTFMVPPPLTAIPSIPTSPNTMSGALIDSNGNSFILTAPIRRRSRGGLHGPRERPPTAEGVSDDPSRPPGAAPSAFTPTYRPKLRSAESLESLRSAPHDSRRISLPATTRPQSQASPHSLDTPTRRQRYSAQPTSWRPLGLAGASQENGGPVDEGNGSSLPYLGSVSSHESPPPRPVRSQPPPNLDSPSLSRRHALRRHSGLKGALL